MSIADDFKALVAKLKAGEHHLAAEAETIWQRLFGDGKELAGMAKQDGAQVAEDAKPVLTSAESVAEEADEDGKQLAEQALADVKAATSAAEPTEPPASPAA